MPIKFGLESLKVQAVAARAYAVRSLKSKGFASLGAHVDDSTASQMYNNIQEHPIAIQAVDQTHFWSLFMKVKLLMLVSFLLLWLYC